MALEIFRLVGSVFVDTDEANKSLQKSDKDAESLGKRLVSVGEAAGKFALGVVGAATAAGTALVAVAENTREYRTEQGKLQAAFETSGFAAGEATSTYAALNGILGDSGQAVEAANHLAKLCDNTEDLAKWTNICTGVYATFGDSLPIEGLTEAANETAKVGQVTGPLADALNWAGISEDAFNESLAACTSEQERQALITKTLSGLYTDAADKYREINGEVIAANVANDKLSASMAKVGGAIEPIVTQGKMLMAQVLEKAVPYIELLASVWIPALIAMITNCCTWISENGDKIVEWTGYIVAAGAAVGTFLTIINWGQIMSAAAAALDTVTVSVKALNVAMNKNKVAAIISAIVGLITWLVYLYNTNEEFRAKVDEVVSFIWGKLQAVFGWLQANVFPVIQSIGELLATYLLPIIENLYAWYVSTLFPAIQNILAWLYENVPVVMKMIVDWVKENVIPVIEDIIFWIRTRLIPCVQYAIGWIKENVIPVIEDIVAWIKSDLVPAIQTIIAWMRDNLLPVIQNIISWIGEHIVPVIERVVSWISEKIGAFFSWFTELFQSTSDKTGGIWEKIKGFFSSAWDFIVGIWEACQPFFQGVWDGVILPVAGMYEEMIGAFQMAWDVIKLCWEKCEPFFSFIWESIKLSVEILWTLLSTGFKNAWEQIKFIWNMVVPYFKLCWENIKAVFSVVVAILGGFFKTAWEVIKATWDTVISYFTMVWAGIKAVFAVVKGVLSGDFSDAWEAIKNLWDKAKAYFDSVWTGIKNVFGSVGSWFGNTFKAAWNAVKNVFSAWGSFFGSLWTQIKDKFSAIGTNISNAISSSVKSGLNGVISAIEGIINSGVNMINGAINLINQIPGVSIGQMSKLSLPRLAKGGVVDEPTVAQIGEDGAEAVIPLERNTGWIDRLAGKIAQTSIVQYGQPTDEKSLDKVISKMDELLDALQANQTITLNKREFARIVKEVG